MLAGTATIRYRSHFGQERTDAGPMLSPAAQNYQEYMNRFSLVYSSELVHHVLFPFPAEHHYDAASNVERCLQHRWSFMCVPLSTTTLRWLVGVLFGLLPPWRTLRSFCSLASSQDPWSSTLRICGRLVAPLRLVLQAAAKQLATVSNSAPAQQPTLGE